MKRILCLFLTLCFVLFPVSCGANEKETETIDLPETETGSEPKKENEQKETKETATKNPWELTERVYESADDPLTPEKLSAIPIANSSMSSDELRQICVDYVCLSTTFQWIPSTDFQYVAEGQGALVTFYEGQLYGGIPYVNTASGNLYRIMELYNTETAVLDMLPFRMSKLLYGTACSGTAGWGWQRVVNSANVNWTAGMTVKNGFIRLGDYTYSDTIDRFGEGSADDCTDIAKKNGKIVMFEAYAKVLKADCLVNNGHVRMAKENAVVVRKDDGTIDGSQSYILHCEQGLYTTSEIHDRYTSDGTKYKIQGNDNLKVTFNELYKTGYLPHTFGEFIGTDPVEQATVSFPYAEKTASFTDLQKGSLSANYTISDVFVNIFDKDGNEVLSHVKRAENHFTRSIDLGSIMPGSAILKYQESGEYTISVSCQLSNGEKLVAYSGTLVPPAPSAE